MRFSRAFRRSGLGLLTSLVTAFALLATATAAASTTTASEVSSGEYAAQSDSYSCFTYRGTFREGTDVLRVNWALSGPECFGVAPSGTIWHTWPGAGGWHEMPGNGRADAIYRYYDFEETNGERIIVVITGSYTLWSQYHSRGRGWSGHWSECC